MNITNMLYLLLGLLVLKGVSGLVCVDGCFNCLFDSGVCRACKYGKIGEHCDLNCTFADNCKLRICTIDGKRCHTNCIDGNYGDMCEKECPSKLCVGNICGVNNGRCNSCPNGTYGNYCTKDCPSTCQTCHRDSGACTDTCPDGTFGEACDKNCLVKNCLYKRCDRVSGDCTYTCEYGFYGDNCSLPCPHNRCQSNRCDRFDGKCIGGCVNGLHGENCDKSCNVTNCVNQRCDQKSALCVTCVTGFYGKQCEKQCSVKNCRSNCDRFTGACSDCQYGKYGCDCELSCPGSCYSVYCDRFTGKCPGICYGGISYCTQCAAGLHGDYCLECLNTNCSTCDSGGNCTSCGIGRFGKSCEMECSFNCAHTNDTPACDMDTGECLHGCHYGDGCRNGCQYIDEQCLECAKTDRASFECFRCKTGFYISNINDNRTTCLPCGHCLNQTCSMETGVCPKGCFLGYWGERCITACQEGCSVCDRLSGVCILYTNYTNSVGCIACNENCKANANDSSCDTTNGRCLHGCEDETFYGPTCDSNCSGFCKNGVCEQSNGHCREGCSLNQLVGAFCNETCSSNCFQSQCDSRNGQCLNGCRLGYYDTKCDSRCPDNCAFGADRSTSECYEISGACKYGCTSGFVGTRCDIIESSNDRVIMPYAIGGGLGMVGVLVLIIVCSVFLKRRISRRTPESDVRRPNEHDSSGNAYYTELAFQSQASDGGSTSTATTSHN